MKKQLQKKYGVCAALLSVFVLTFLGLGACANPLQNPAERSPDGSTGVRISIVTGGERTLLPTGTFSKYVLHFSTSDGVTVPEDVTLTDTDAIIPLAPADWAITVTAYVDAEGADVPAAEGSAQVSLSAGELKGVSIRVSSKLDGDNGYFSYDVSYPENVSSGYLAVYESGGSPVIEKYLTAEPTGNRIALAPGYYGLRVSLERPLGMAVRTEIVHIYPGMETRGDYVFGEADFGSPIVISGTVDLSGLETASYAAIRLYRNSDFTYQVGAFSGYRYDSSAAWAWSVPMLPFNQPTDLYVELTLLSNAGQMIKRLPVPISAYNQDVDVPLGPFTVNQFNLSGVVDCSVLTALGITDINSAVVRIYQDGSSPSSLGSIGINVDYSWSFGILTEEASLPARIVLNVNTSGGSIYDEIKTTLSASRSDLNFTPGPIGAETTINGVSANDAEYWYLFVPDTSGVYAFNASGAGSQYTYLNLYNASGNLVNAASGNPGAALSSSLTAGAVYYVRLFLNTSYRAFQFRVNPVSQASLGGTVDFDDLLAPFSGVSVSSADIKIYADTSAHTLLGTSSISAGDGSWSTAVGIEGPSVPVVFVIAATLSNGQTIYDQAYGAISGSDSGLNFSPEAVGEGTAVTRATVSQNDYLLYVPETTGDYSFRVSAGADQSMGVELYNAQTGSAITTSTIYGTGEIELVRTLTAENPYCIRVRVYNPDQFVTYQFLAGEVQPVTLGGTVSLSGLAPLLSDDIDHTEIRVYSGASNPVQLGSPVTVESNGAWSATIPASGTQAVRITAYTYLKNGRMIITHRQDTISGNTLGLDLAPAAVSPASGQPEPRVSGSYSEDSFLLVPSASGLFHLETIGSGTSELMNFSLHDAVTGARLAQGLNSLYASLTAGAPYIVFYRTGTFTAYQFRMSALSSASIGGSINYSGLPSPISAAISSATVSGYLEPSHTQIVSGTPVTEGAWSTLVPSNAVNQTATLILTLNLDNGRAINSHIQTVLSAPLDFAPTSVPYGTAVNSKTSGIGADWLLFVPAAGGVFTLQAGSNTTTRITVYEGLTGTLIGGNESFPSAAVTLSLSAETPYIIQINCSGYIFRDYQFYVGPPPALGGTVDFSGLTAWSADSAGILVFYSASTSQPYPYNVQGTGAVSLPGGGWSASASIGEVFIALVGLSSEGEGVLETQTVNVSGDNTAIDFSPEDSNKNVATGVWHDRSANGVTGEWLLWIPETTGTYVLDAERTDGSMDPYMYLYDGLTGNELASNDDGGDGNSSRIQHLDFAAGYPYLIRVRDYYVGSGSFRFKAEEVATP